MFPHVLDARIAGSAETTINKGGRGLISISPSRRHWYLHAELSRTAASKANALGVLIVEKKGGDREDESETKGIVA